MFIVLISIFSIFSYLTFSAMTYDGEGAVIFCFSALVVAFIIIIIILILGIYDSKLHKFELLTVFIVALPFMFALCIMIMKKKDINLATLSGDRWISIFGSILSYYGSATLGLITLWQNIKLRKINKEMQKREQDRINYEIQKFYPLLKVVKYDYLKDTSYPIQTIKLQGINSEKKEKNKKNKKNNKKNKSTQTNIYKKETLHIADNIDSINIYVYYNEIVKKQKNARKFHYIQFHLTNISESYISTIKLAGINIDNKRIEKELIEHNYYYFLLSPDNTIVLNTTYYFPQEEDNIIGLKPSLFTIDLLVTTITGEIFEERLEVIDESCRLIWCRKK